MKKYLIGVIGAFAALTIFGTVSFASVEMGGEAEKDAVEGVLGEDESMLGGEGEGMPGAGEDAVMPGEGEGMPGAGEGEVLGANEGQSEPSEPPAPPESPESPETPDTSDTVSESESSSDPASDTVASPSGGVLGENLTGTTSGTTTTAAENNPATGALETAAFGAFALGSLAIAATSRKKR